MSPQKPQRYIAYRMVGITAAPSWQGPEMSYEHGLGESVIAYAELQSWRQALQGGPAQITILRPLLVNDSEINKYTTTLAIPVRDRGGPYGWEMLRISHCLDNRLTDGGEVVSRTRRSRFVRGWVRTRTQQHWNFFLCGSRRWLSTQD
jgi:hypothetical protein